jgi:hypothetical protein
MKEVVTMGAKTELQTAEPQNTPKLTAQDVATFERLVSQLERLYEELSTLSKKSPDGAVNRFKLGIINEKLEELNSLLGEGFKPSKNFSVFDVDNVPTNSDVVLMLSQYLNMLGRWRSAHIANRGIEWVWVTTDGTHIEA